MADEADRPMTGRKLYDALARFQTDNARSHDVEMRWLASHMDDLRLLAARVMNSQLNGDERARVKAFRAAEIETEIAAKRDELAKLERDLKLTMGLTLQGAA